MKIRFLPPAIAELDEAVAWYEREQAGLERRFLNDFTHALNSIAAFPEGWHQLSRRTRRCRLRRFPYGVVYQLREGQILVIAVAHLHREPGYWQGRVS
ncbi:type II toxin-antitoxin system RelE/ParE family toxin [Mariprofundus erugo]|uniref:Type II toxin-antitoxin system RelE/ParE family toxin n=1 Tax=Mariprofundus erugo TaxID=2528639 RepID=A0A5R9GTQ4_9PROT|nr:type II toxin-antitoxin system RelE/ParE family toxin [Mariprofundus erugo]